MVLTQRLWSLRLREGEDMASHLNEFRDLANQIANLSAGDDSTQIQGVDLVSMLSLSLPDSYEPLIMALQSRSEELTFDFMAGRLLQESTRRQAASANGNGPSNGQSAFVAGSGRFEGRRGNIRGNKSQRGARFNGRGRSNFGATDATRFGNTGANQGREKKVSGRCHYCDKEGHWKNECLKRKADETGGKHRKEQEGQHTAFTATMNKRNEINEWIIDSGASQHISAHRNRFINYQTIRSMKIQIGDGSEIEAIGKGDMELTIGSMKITLVSVLHVPAIGSNLLSVAKIVDHGHHVVFSPTGCHISSDQGTRVQGIREGNIYLLRTENRALVALSNRDSATTAEVWLRRLGHRDFSQKAQEVLHKGVTGLEIRGEEWESVDRVCTTCAAGRQHKETMTGTREKTENLLQNIHSDVCGPMETPTLTGERYFVTFIDEASGRLAVSLMRSKADVLENFTAYRQRAEKDTGRQIKCLRSDGGGEYVNRRFTTYLREAGIVKVTTPPYTPAQNGIAERANRTLTEAARCMLQDAGLGNEYWGYAILAATHIINRMPSRVHGNKSPYEIWTGNIPSVAHFRVFGCPAHVLIPAENRRKLDSKSAHCTFLGYAENQGTRVYKLYQPETGKTFTSRDVVFDEVNNQRYYSQGTPGLPPNIPSGSAKVPITHEKYITKDPVSQQNLEAAQYQTPEEERESYLETEPIASTLPANDDADMEDTITLRAPHPPTQRSEYHSATPIVSEETRSQRPQRVRKPVDLFKPSVWRVRAMIAHTNEEPRTLEEALASDDAADWKMAWDSEVKSLNDNGTWVLENLPEGRKAIGCRWVFKIKEDGRYKARLVAKGYAQAPGIDYNETFAPVAKFTTLRTLLALSAENDWELEGMDVKTAFLHSELAELIYMEIPEGLKPEGEYSPRLVCRLVKTIYGLKQAPRAWYGNITTFLSEKGFYRSEEDHSLFVHEEHSLIILLYVDDLVLAAATQGAIEWAKKELKRAFKMTELGRLKTFIGLEVTRDRKRRVLHVSQPTYVDRILWNHGMQTCAPVSTPIEPGTRLEKSPEGYTATSEDMRRYQSAVGSLMYAMLGSRPDIAYAVGTVSRFCTNPDGQHWAAVKRIFRYLAGTREIGLTYGGRPSCEGYCDSDWGSSEDRRSTTGYVFILNGGAISWASRRQPVVALSSTKAEYMAMTQAVKEVLWLRTLFLEVGAPNHAAEISKIYSDNQGAIALANNPGFHARSKHIDIQYHFIRSHVDQETGTIDLRYCPTEDMTADVLTKGLPRDRHQKHAAAMGLA